MNDYGFDPNDYDPNGNQFLKIPINYKAIQEGVDLLTKVNERTATTGLCKYFSKYEDFAATHLTTMSAFLITMLRQNELLRKEVGELKDKVSSLDLNISQRN